MQQLSPNGIGLAVEYARKHGLHGLLIRQGGRILAEEYAEPFGSGKPHALYSGTKSFWGICAAAAREDGLLDLDEPVHETIPQWRTDTRKALVTIRQLLNLTAGIAFGGLGAGVPTYDGALAKPLANDPGTTFTYGGIPLQVFGAVLARKLGARNQTPLDYLKTRILEPAAIRIASWRTLKDGTFTMPTGAMMTAREWLKYGELICSGGVANGRRIVAESSVSECLMPGVINPRYGLGFWLQQPGKQTPFAAYASGAGKQALYILPEAKTVVAHFSQTNSYKHETFLQRLFTP